MTKKNRKQTVKLISFVSVTLVAATIICQMISMNTLAAADNVSITDLSAAVGRKVSQSDSSQFNLTNNDTVDTPVPKTSFVQKSLSKKGSPRILTNSNDATVIDSGTCGENITWTLTSDGLLKLEGSGVMYTYREDDGLPWDTHAESISMLEISTSITYISNYAFECLPNLIEVVTPFRWNVPRECFHHCPKLSKITLSSGVWIIGRDAFSACDNLKSIDIPKSVKTIGSDAFDSSGLTTVNYEGSECDWNKITINSGNSKLLSATRNYASSDSHTWQDVIDQEPTCETTGKKHEECSVCHAKRNENTLIPATGEHSWQDVIDVAPTCGATGKKHEECSVCHAKRNENTVISATGEHSWQDVIDVAPTCGATGKKHEECSVCHAKQNENHEIPALGHDWDNGVVTKAPTTTKKGEKTYTCKRDGCGATKTKSIPATGNNTGGNTGDNTSHSTHNTHDISDYGNYSFVPDGTKDGDVSNAKVPVYQWREHSNKSLLFVIKNASDDSRTFEKFTGKVWVDGVIVVPKHYTAIEGSLRLTLKSSYLKTLSTGDHTIRISFNDGSASQKFTILSASTGYDSPNTGESSTPIALCLLLLTASSTCATAFIIRKKPTHP